MTDSEKTPLVQVLTNNSLITTDTINAYLALAKDRILTKMYPMEDYESNPTRFPWQPRYDRTQCELAARMIDRRGTEGEKSHNENGVNRVYGSVDDADILARVVQVVRM